MAKALILYYTRSGNTEKMANIIAEGLRNNNITDVTIKKIQDTKPSEWLEYDAILIGTPVYYGMPAAEIKQAIDDSVKYHGKFKGKIGGAFASSANVGGGNETSILDILHALMIHGMIIQGDPIGDHYGPVSIGSPDERAKKNCLAFGKLIAELCKKIVPEKN